MHDHLSEVLGEEVVGEVACVGDSFFDVGLGRVCLERLDAKRARELAALVQQAFPDAEVEDRLHLDDPQQQVRGLLELRLRDPETESPYLLQITSRPLLTFYERRFWIADGVAGDTLAVFGRGLAAVVGAVGNAPLRLFSHYEELRAAYLGRLDNVLRAAVAGLPIDVLGELGALVSPLQRAWALLPWPLKSGLSPVSVTNRERLARHDRVMRRTVIFALRPADGKLLYQYQHEHNPTERYEQVLGWMTEIHRSLSESFTPPEHAMAVARASSVGQFIDTYPAFARLVGNSPSRARG